LLEVFLCHLIEKLLAL